ncbi:hypothetical protein BJX68DRAFT_242529 [Aspergillus pseudodeflectus]|uniref:Xylanolytic transcriptional activator regulatory domain-containing protein n=1 Tax=Aspergillus pseudodeflectus TaxID=176178 RepID=A0ABR4JXW1_9EURO
MELTFLIGKDGRNVKRPQSHRACSLCRQRKKRCSHNPSCLRRSSPRTPKHLHVVPQSDAPSEQTSPLSNTEQELTISPPTSVSEAHTAPEDLDLAGRQFLCDTNPVVGLLEDRGSRLHRGRSDRGDVGAWVDQSHTSSPGAVDRNSPLLGGQDLDNQHHVGDSNPVVSLLDGKQPGLQHGHAMHGVVGAWFDQRTSSSLRNGDNEQRSEQETPTSFDSPALPPRGDMEALLNIYFDRIHSLLPLLDEDEIRSQSALGTLSIPLLQAIILVASKDRAATPFLRLGSDTAVLRQERFSERIYNDILKNMPKKEEKKRILTLQILTLLSLHDWGTDGAEESSLHLNQAIHHSETIGLHHLATPERQTKTSLKALFWCLWSLDKWNAAINGRTIMINDCDLSHGVQSAIPMFEPPFRVWLHLADQLSSVIKAYRPIADGARSDEMDVLTFEELIDRSVAWDIRPGLLDSFEFYHHAVVLLSTYSNGLQGRSHTRASNIRHSHSVLTLASLCRDKDVRDLSPLSMSAYTLSLVFSITYKLCKTSKLRSVRTQARLNLEVFYTRLKCLSSTWWLAAIMTSLGGRAMESLDRQSRVLPDASDEVETPASPRSDSQLPPGYSTTRPLNTQMLDKPASAANIPDGYLHDQALPPMRPDSFELATLAAADPETFDIFLDNFPDVNFSCAASDQLFWDMEI